MAKRSIPTATRNRVLAAYEAGITDPVDLSCKCLVTVTVVNAVLAEVSGEAPQSTPAGRNTVDRDRVLALLAEDMAPKGVASACGCTVDNVYRIRRRAAASAPEVPGGHPTAGSAPASAGFPPYSETPAGASGDPQAPAAFSEGAPASAVSARDLDLPPAQRRRLDILEDIARGGDSVDYHTLAQRFGCSRAGAIGAVSRLREKCALRREGANHVLPSGAVLRLPTKKHGPASHKPPAPPSAPAPKRESIPLMPMPAPRPRAPGAVLALDDLGPNDCRWPHGDPRKPGFHFCGATQAPGRVYCPEHTAQAYTRREG